MNRLAFTLPVLLAPIIAVSWPTGSATAQEVDAKANFNLLITQPSYSGGDPNCGALDFDWIDGATCAELASAPHAGPAFVWVVISHEDAFPRGIGAVQFGIDYTAGISEWTLCTGGLAIPEIGWPASGTGYSATWSNGCYYPPGENAKVGLFIVDDGTTGSMSIIGDPRIDTALYSDCESQLYDVCDLHLGAADLAVGTVPLCDRAGVPASASNCLATDGLCPVTVSWTHGGELVSAFEIRRDGILVDDVDPGLREYEDWTALAGVRYEYTVVAANDCGAADPSGGDLGSSPPLASAAECVASDGECALVRVAWQDLSSNETGFKILRSQEFIATTDPDVTEYIDTDVVPGRHYDYAIVATGGCGDAPPSNEDTGVAPGLPDRPSRLTASQTECLFVRVQWRDESYNESGFRVLRDGAPLADVEASSGEWYVTYDDSTAVPGIEYSYTVIALHPCVDSTPSDPAIGMRWNVPPAAASDLAATTDLCGLVRLNWQDNSSDETGFKILRDAALIATVASGTLTYDDSTGAAGASYSYRIVATSGCGDGNPTNPITGTLGTDPPTAAEECVASEALCHIVRVTWQDRSDDETGFQIIRNGLEIATATANATSYDDSAATPDVVHEFSVVAVNSCGEATASNVDTGVLHSVPIPETPVAIAPPDTACIDPRVTLRWHSAAGAVAYGLRIGTTCDSGDVWDTVVSDTTREVLLAPGDAYFWQVRALNECDGASAWTQCRRFRAFPDFSAPYSSYEDLGDETLFWWIPTTGVDHYDLVLGCWNEELVLEVFGIDTTLNVYDLGLDDPDRWTAWVQAVACDSTGQPSDCMGPGTGMPVLLEELAATPGPGGIVISWRTGREAGVAGFNLYRRVTTGATDERVNPMLIPGGRRDYEYVDARVTPDAEYVYRLTEQTLDGPEVDIGHVTARAFHIPSRVALRQNVPNPFNPRTTFEFWLPDATDVGLVVLDASGRRVRTLIAVAYPAGVHRVTWGGRDDEGRLVASGIYFARLRAGGSTLVRRLTLLK